MSTIQILVSISVGLFAALVITLYIAREAYARGKQAHVKDMYRALVESRKAAQHRQQDCAAAMEEQESRHQEELLRINGTYAQKFKEVSNARQEAEAINQDLRAEIVHWNDEASAEIARLRAATLTQNEIQLLEDMVGKLRLSSASLHATQQFAAARQAKELANRGGLLARRLRPVDAKGEAA